MSLQVKKILIIPLLALALMPALFAAYFVIHLRIAQHEAKEKLEKSLLQTICIKQSDFSWVRKGKEIRIAGHLFDVKIIQEIGDGFIITGLYDEQEDQLHEQLNNFNSEHNSAQNKLCDFFFHLFYTNVLQRDDEFHLSTAKTIYIYYYSLALPAPFEGGTYQPPDGC